jgi:ABC-2 type transport system ATP-binding protein
VTSVPLVALDDVGLAYRLSRSHAASLKEAAVQAVRGRMDSQRFWALRGVSFQVHPGEVLGVVGRNGAGKSTLMKVVSRVLPPTTGRVVVRGRTAPLIELGAGFEYELTALENIVLYGTYLGREADHMRKRAQPIAEWAGLQDQLSAPLRTFSSGMLARLAFSIAVDVDPRVLVVDEVLSVGDEAFRSRSSQKIDQLIHGGAAVLLVTHDLQQLITRSTRAVWLEQGVVRLSGSPETVVEHYRAAVG